ncbi:MAG: hypothetical protein WAT37_17275 [Saprospiraceae bacterium]
MKKIINLSLIDFKLIFRDPSLRTFLVFPLILLSLIIWGLPPLLEKYNFLLTYLPIFLVVAIIENTQMFTFISTMVLIDEKETEVAKVYGILPFTKLHYLVSRFLIPYLFTAAINIILLLIQPYYAISILNNLIISFLTALIVPVYVLAINSIVKNRLQGMVYIKAFNMLVLIPIAAFFVPDRIKHVFGIFPTHWIFQTIVNVTNNVSIGAISIIGFLYLFVLLFIVSRQFIRKHFV